MKSIKIAPGVDEVYISGNKVWTDWSCRITYRAPGLERYRDDYVRRCFIDAIALCSKTWQIEELMNKHLHLDGEIIVTTD